MTTVGSLFTGYGGLDMGVMIALDSSARIAWTSDVEPGPCKVGSPHQRARLFVIGYPHGEPWDLRRATGTSEAARGWPLSHPARSGLGNAQHVAGTLLPTPQATNASRSSAGYGPNLHEIATSADQAENHNSQHGSSNGSWACPTATSPAQT